MGPSSLGPYNNNTGDQFAGGPVFPSSSLGASFQGPPLLVSNLKAATHGSAAADLPIAETITLSPGGGPYKLRTNVFGPLPQGTFALLLGRSSAALRGITVFPGVIDPDYRGEICIVAQVSKVISLLAGERIAQLLLLPYVPFPTINRERIGGFGSTGKYVYWEMFINDSGPSLTLIINQQPFEGLIDTGANVSVISLLQWPATWEKRKCSLMLSGIGATYDVWQSAQPLSCCSSGGKEMFITFYIVKHTH